MKKIILPAFIAASSLLFSCGGAEQVAQHVLDSMNKDSADRAFAKQKTTDSLRAEDSIANEAKKMRQDFITDSTRKADSMKSSGKGKK